ncbi:alpha/beta fold hydrolase [Salidesulfovibrio onnuriiensis]|uniref:alpha/beta fold hydrolase n=1 Tax=Salidesulfovibrio onnuriiensis TaxID=2583823 RepID=UPI0011CB9F6E|nr:alpha/beta hydrolase [Salidesulfovibrio onnuriiensis]
MSLTFVSGWAGYPELYPGLAKRAEFLLPFVGMDERTIVRQLQRGGDTLMAWSTGAHMVLKYWRAIEPHFGRIVLAAPFLDFTSFTPERVVRLMLRQFGKDPGAVLHQFLKNCGCPRTVACDPAHAEPLAQGLRYLLESRAHPAHSGGHKVVLVHGQHDRIVAPEASEDILQHLHGARFLALPCGHWIPENELFVLLD